MTKKHNINPNLDEYEQDIEDNLDSVNPLQHEDKARKISKLEVAAKAASKTALINAYVILYLL